ncbi:MAG TPA: O-antigen ligase family protein [Verrucomicrobiae bacterium]|jgi:hypothetical protein
MHVDSSGVASLPRKFIRLRARPDAIGAEARGPGAVRLFGFIAIHLPLALAMKQQNIVAAVHAAITLLFGLWCCCTQNRPRQLAMWAGYMAGCEALWRMCGAPIPWEFSALGICLILFISLMRGASRSQSWLPAAYLALLAPGCVLTFMVLSFGEARQQVSFYIAPAAALALCAMSFSRLRLTPIVLQGVGAAIAAPVAGMAMIAIFGIAKSQTTFISASNVAASGGYGPNQVSAMLSLGALMMVFLYVGARRSYWLRAGSVVLGLWLLGQSMMTFSRTGAYLFAASFVAAAFFLAQSKGGGWRIALLLTVLAASACAVLPMLDSFTGGQLLHRFQDEGLTGRDEIAKTELKLWLKRPVLGNGVGMSMYDRSAMSHAEAPAAHTEYTRLLAEHGLLGGAALVILLVMAVRAFFRAQGPWAKAVVAALAIWSFLFMAVTAMRLVAPGFLLGLIQARMQAEQGPPRLAVVQARRAKSRGWMFAARKNPR